MKLVYWAAKCLDDNATYNIRERTKKAAVESRTEALSKGLPFGPVTKVEVPYQGGDFGLMRALLSAGGESLLPDNEEQARIYRRKS